MNPLKKQEKKLLFMADMAKANKFTTIKQAQ